MRYLARRVESRVDLRTWLPWAQTVIVVAARYEQDPPQKPMDTPRGQVARYAWGEDYHVVMKKRLGDLVELIRAHWGTSFEAKVCVDTSAITERELAAAAGIGWIGKNTLVLNSGIGSYFFLGEIITDLDLAIDSPEPDHCGTCTRCLDACPTAALTAPYQMDARRCISYLTIEHRGDIDPALAEQIGGWVFGCDICQEVCPFNNDVPDGEARTAVDTAYPPIIEIERWSNAQYEKHVNGRAIDRATLDMWKRNARIAAVNAIDKRV